MATATSSKTATNRRGTSLPEALQKTAIASDASGVSPAQREVITGALARVRRIPDIRDPHTIEEFVHGFNTLAKGLSYEGHRFRNAEVLSPQKMRIYFIDPDKNQIHMDFTLETLPAPFRASKT
jgi:hypothetical protein